MEQINLNNIPLAPEQCVTGFGTTLVVAPHADDESLGCGGLISLLRKYGQAVYVVLLSDGTLSHPNSKEFPAEKLRDLREEELLNAAGILGVPAENIIFCRYKDRSVPSVNTEKFEEAVQHISKIIDIIKPQSVFVPWRRDPHPDHRAAFHLIDNADVQNAKRYEYPIWLSELGSTEDIPTDAEVMPFRLNISSVLEKKQNAILQHRSQVTDLISDDPEGFQLSKEMLAQYNEPYETFFISKS